MKEHAAAEHSVKGETPKIAETSVRMTSPTSRIAISLAVAGALLIVGVYLYMLFIVVGASGFPASEILKDHYAAIVGLPASAAVSFVLVVLLRQTEGPIEFEGLGFKFKGAAGQVAMWVICFLAFAVAIKACW